MLVFRSLEEVRAAEKLEPDWLLALERVMGDLASAYAGTDFSRGLGGTVRDYARCTFYTPVMRRVSHYPNPEKNRHFVKRCHVMCGGRHRGPPAPP